MLKGVLGLEPEARRNAVILMLPGNRDENGRVVSDHSYLLKIPAAPADLLIEEYALLESAAAAEAELRSFMESRCCTPESLLAPMIEEFKRAKAAAVGGLLQHIDGAKVAAWFAGKRTDLRLYAPIELPLAMWYPVHITDDDLAKYLQRSKPSDKVAMPDEDFAAGVSERRAALDKIAARMETIRATPGRFDALGRDLWHAFFAAILYFNERSIRPSDAAGRATNDKAIVDFLKRLAIKNAAAVFQADWFEPTEQHRLYAKQGGKLFLHFAAARNA